MACTDCHTVRGVIGSGKRYEAQLDIQCLDCHPKKLFCKPLSQLQAGEVLYSTLYPDNFYVSADGLIVVSEKNGPPISSLGRKWWTFF